MTDGLEKQAWLAYFLSILATGVLAFVSTPLFIGISVALLIVSFHFAHMQSPTPSRLSRTLSWVLGGLALVWVAGIFTHSWMTWGRLYERTPTTVLVVSASLADLFTIIACYAAFRHMLPRLSIWLLRAAVVIAAASTAFLAYRLPTPGLVIGIVVDYGTTVPYCLVGLALALGVERSLTAKWRDARVEPA